jgi:hypothetical protein
LRNVALCSQFASAWADAGEVEEMQAGAKSVTTAGESRSGPR